MFFRPFDLFLFQGHFSASLIMAVSLEQVDGELFSIERVPPERVEMASRDRTIYSVGKKTK